MSAIIPPSLDGLLRGYDTDIFDGLAEALGRDPSVSIRINPAKQGAAVWPGKPVEWCPTGRYLPERPAFTLDPRIHQGAYYVQDASSMFLWHVLKRIAQGPVRCLDACAAPGGKTTVALDALPEGSVVVANEADPRRAAVLRENLTKWGAPLCVVRQGPAENYAQWPSAFDVIVADVPCSGEGMMRKDAAAVAQWSPQLVAQCAARQREIVEKLWTALRPGGYMVYSTCTFNRAENEENVKWIIDRWNAEPVDIPIEGSWGIAGAVEADFPAYRFIPGRVEGEGLFMAVVRKPDGVAPALRCGKPRRRSNGKAHPALPTVRQWVDAEEFTVADDGTVRAKLPTVFPGFPFEPMLEVAVIKGRDAVPTHQLAMSTLLKQNAFPAADVSRDEALCYLRNGNVQLPEGTPRGHVLLRYDGRPLGFVKNIGSRANNLYPKQWRILSQR